MIVEVRTEFHEFHKDGKPNGHYERFELSGELPREGNVKLKSLWSGSTHVVNVENVVVIQD